ncbi:hypothetical protein ACFU99_31025, partial [Streptomyces sp. NPDC057654]
MTATALIAVTAVAVPAAAVAAPSGAEVMSAGIGTSDEQRVDAASVVHLDPSPDVLLLSDRDFIFALWEKARDAGERLEAVRTAAEEAMGSTSADDHVRFIATGIHQAFEADKQREKDRADAERAARQSKAQALIAVGIPVAPDLLGLSDDNFIRKVMQHPDAGAEVKAAAARALAGSPADWREFITNGAREAHDRDVAKELEELEEKNREEALATDPSTGKTEARAVTDVIVGEGSKNLVEVAIASDAGTGNAIGKLAATGNHPFWAAQQGRWLEIFNGGGSGPADGWAHVRYAGGMRYPDGGG